MLAFSISSLPSLSIPQSHHQLCYHERSAFFGLKNPPSKRVLAGSQGRCARRITSPTCVTASLTRIALLVSGGGRSLENICDQIERHQLQHIEVSVVISSKETAGALDRARQRDIPTSVIRRKNFDSVESFSDAISRVCDDHQVDLIVMAGWMHFYLIPLRYTAKVLNIHPSLIPAFCGKGYYGDKVHKAVIDFGCKISGCTVHFADNKYDHGPIVLQRSVPVFDGDDEETLATRVFEQEKKALPEAIQLFANGMLEVEGRMVRILYEPIII